jgi:hypothetical protein
VIAPDQFDEFEIRARCNRLNIDFDDVRAAILANLDDLIDDLIPVSSRGKTKGDEFWCCNPTRPDKNRTRSASIRGSVNGMISRTAREVTSSGCGNKLRDSLTIPLPCSILRSFFVYRTAD